MPDIAQQDMSYQPATKGYSFSTNPAVATRPGGKPKKKVNTFILLFFEILGLIAVFAVFLLILNFFNIISLSSIFPKNTTPATIPVNAGVNQSSAPANFTKLANQASDAPITKYTNFAAGFSKPTVQANPNDYVSDAVFSGYDNQTIQIVTSEGILNLSFDQNTLFQRYPKPVNQTDSSQSSGMLFKPIKYSSSQDFFRNVVFGSTLQVFFSKPNLKTTQVNYIESIKPVL